LVAQGIVEALGRVDVKSPIVVRLDGTNADEGRAILKEHESDTLFMAPTMLEAAAKVVALARSGSAGQGTGK
jgi:succinyl-CoA synthetase beta subunit